jgi:hypothetical protein
MIVEGKLLRESMYGSCWIDGNGGEGRELGGRGLL